MTAKPTTAIICFRCCHLNLTPITVLRRLALRLQRFLVLLPWSCLSWLFLEPQQQLCLPLQQNGKPDNYRTWSSGITCELLKVHPSSSWPSYTKSNCDLPLCCPIQHHRGRWLGRCLSPALMKLDKADWFRDKIKFDLPGETELETERESARKRQFETE